MLHWDTSMKYKTLLYPTACDTVGITAWTIHSRNIWKKFFSLDTLRTKPGTSTLKRFIRQHVNVIKEKLILKAIHFPNKSTIKTEFQPMLCNKSVEDFSQKKKFTFDKRHRRRMFQQQGQNCNNTNTVSEHSILLQCHSVVLLGESFPVFSRHYHHSKHRNQSLSDTPSYPRWIYV
jgi:hypothetical protein